MARKIDLANLSEDDRQYLVQRCQWAKLAEADGVTPKEAQRQAATAALQRKAASPAPDPQPATVVAGGAPVVPDQGSDPLDGKPYSEWPYKALQEELKVRKAEAIDDGLDVAEADELYKAGGTAAELVKRLEEDDARVAAQEAQQ